MKTLRACPARPRKGPLNNYKNAARTARPAKPDCTPQTAKALQLLAFLVRLNLNQRRLLPH
jgi:hypothetical protein